MLHTPHSDQTNEQVSSMMLCPVQLVCDPRMMQHTDHIQQPSLILNVQNVPPWLQRSQNVVYINQIPNKWFKWFKWQYAPYNYVNMVPNAMNQSYYYPSMGHERTLYQNASNLGIQNHLIPQNSEMGNFITQNNVITQNNALGHVIHQNSGLGNIIPQSNGLGNLTPHNLGTENPLHKPISENQAQNTQNLNLQDRKRVHVLSNTRNQRIMYSVPNFVTQNQISSIQIPKNYNTDTPAQNNVQAALTQNADQNPAKNMESVQAVPLPQSTGQNPAKNLPSQLINMSETTQNMPNQTSTMTATIHRMPNLVPLNKAVQNYMPTLVPERLVQNIMPTLEYQNPAIQMVMPNTGKENQEKLPISQNRANVMPDSVRENIMANSECQNSANVVPNLSAESNMSHSVRQEDKSTLPIEHYMAPLERMPILTKMLNQKLENFEQVATITQEVQTESSNQTKPQMLTVNPMQRRVTDRQTDTNKNNEEINSINEESNKKSRQLNTEMNNYENEDKTVTQNNFDNNNFNNSFFKNSTAKTKVPDRIKQSLPESISVRTIYSPVMPRFLKPNVVINPYNNTNPILRSELKESEVFNMDKVINTLEDNNLKNNYNNAITSDNKQNLKLNNEHKINTQENNSTKLSHTINNIMSQDTDIKMTDNDENFKNDGEVLRNTVYIRAKRRKMNDKASKDEEFTSQEMNKHTDHTIAKNEEILQEKSENAMSIKEKLKSLIEDRNISKKIEQTNDKAENKSKNKHMIRRKYATKRKNDEKKTIIEQKRKITRKSNNLSKKNDENNERNEKINEFESKNDEVIGISSKFVHTHVIDGLVIQESNIAFPILKPKESIKTTKVASRSTHENKMEVLEDNPLANVKKSTIQTWTPNQLSNHLMKHKWDDTAAILNEQEIDGESLLLVNRDQLESIGVCDRHTDVIVGYIES